MSAAEIRELARKTGALEVTTTTTARKRQHFDYLIVLDFEATCWDGKTIARKVQNEIIEFAAVLLDVADGAVVDSFQEYVRPTECPKLSSFCTQLTGIEQETVDAAAELEVVLEMFNDWIEKHHVFASWPSTGKRCTFATWSDWDLGICLRKECRRKELGRENYFKKWIDVRKTYMTFYDDRPMGLHGALTALGMSFVGKEHSGIDDAKNTAYLINKMVRDGLFLQNTHCE